MDSTPAQPRSRPPRGVAEFFPQCITPSNLLGGGGKEAPPERPSLVKVKKSVAGDKKRTVATS